MTTCITIDVYTAKLFGRYATNTDKDVRNFYVPSGANADRLMQVVCRNGLTLSECMGQTVKVHVCSQPFNDGGIPRRRTKVTIYEIVNECPAVDTLANYFSRAPGRSNRNANSNQKRGMELGRGRTRSG